MKFGPIPTAEAEGAILAHTHRVRGATLKKGRRLTQRETALLLEAGVAEVVAARLEPGDAGEDEAAALTARSAAGANVRVAEAFTGRANLYATADGVAAIQREAVLGVNGGSEAVTVATVPPYARVRAGQMIATVKIIPFAVPQAVLAAAIEASRGLIEVRAFAPHRAGLVLTRLPATKPGLIDKRTRAIAARLVALGSQLDTPLVVDHRPDEVAKAIAALARSGCDPILVFSASAIVDRGDVVPEGILKAGGEIVRLGLPVDPGNLALLGRFELADVIGVPSCAGSPKLNGFDWILERRLAGLEIGADEFAEMGLGGLLEEIGSRPQPREDEAAAGEPSRRAPRIAALVLAAGRGMRMGGRNKMTSRLRDKPLVRHAVEAALASAARPVIVVTGHEADQVRSALAGLDVTFTHNPDFAAGLSTSLKAGLKAVPAEADGAVVLLGDMPMVEGEHIDRLIAAFSPADERAIVVPMRAGKRGNPVLWGRAFFGELMALEGDIGARAVIGKNAELVAEVALETEAILTDVDTEAALAALDEGPQRAKT